jgi:putative membrane protein
MSLINAREIAANDQHEVLKGLAAGTIGGLVASWVMEEFQAVWTKASEAIQHSQSNGPNGSSSTQGSEQSPGDGEEQEPATVKAAEMISEKILGRQLAKDKKEIAGNAVHYATGAASGAIYGAAAELAPDVTAGAGILFGTAVWLVVDESAVPLLGLSKGPTEYPLSTHVYALASHCVYGLTTEVVRRALRRTILR